MARMRVSSCLPSNKMISGARIVTIEKLQFTSYGVRNGNPFFLNSWSRSAQCSVADGQPHESFCSRVRRDTLESAPNHSYVVQHRYLSLKEDGGVQEWSHIESNFSTSRELPVSKRWPVGDLAEAAGASEETQEYQVGTSGSSEDNAIVDGESLSEEGQSSRGFKLDVLEAVEDLGRKAETLKEDAMSLDFTVSPTPFTPVEGGEAVRFAAICVLLFFMFWLGNYYVPDLIFKDTVFRKEPEEPIDQTGTTSGDKKSTVSSQQSGNGSSDASKTSMGDDGGSPASKSGAGFSQGKKNRPKSAKRK